MNDLLVIEKTETLTKVAKIKDNKLVQLFVSDSENESRQDKIYVGQVVDIVKNLQAVFIDFGVDKKGMLHFKRIPQNYLNKLHLGLKMPVQVSKEQVGDKGDRLTGLINVTGLYFVCLLNEDGVAISKKITDTDKREHLKKLVTDVSDFGFIVRTQAQNVSDNVLKKELLFLVEQANKIMDTKDFLNKGHKFKVDKLSYSKWLLEHINHDIDVLCNDEDELNEVENFLDKVTVTKKLYPKEEAMFKLLGIEKQFRQCLTSKVWIKNGGNIVIEHTEAMTVVDINSAKATETSNSLKLNKIAIEEILSQIILRNIAGIVIVDLVEPQKDKDVLFEYAKELISKYDGKRTKVYPITEIGLMQLTRTRVYKPLHEVIQFKP
ncbi:MAG: hypothetical protein ATN35_11705 [Epulopiscium sp. Nele67-Bin004]|nr:MAG: hypothetical protein ATN35_11705 [Epulopiscium sp. Nele67-Bin004]